MDSDSEFSKTALFKSPPCKRRATSSVSSAKVLKGTKSSFWPRPSASAWSTLDTNTFAARGGLTLHDPPIFKDHRNYFKPKRISIMNNLESIPHYTSKVWTHTDVNRVERRSPRTSPFQLLPVSEDEFIEDLEYEFPEASEYD